MLSLPSILSTLYVSMTPTMMDESQNTYMLLSLMCSKIGSGTTP